MSVVWYGPVEKRHAGLAPPTAADLRLFVAAKASNEGGVRKAMEEGADIHALDPSNAMLTVLMVRRLRIRVHLPPPIHTHHHHHPFAAYSRPPNA